MVRTSSSPTDEHEFHAMGARGFELFSQALHEAQDGILSANTYGETGYAQFGADHIAFRRAAAGVEVEAGQSKAYKAFERDGIRKAVDKFLAHWEDHWREKRVRRLILFVGCNIKKPESADEIVIQTLRLEAMNVAFEVWDANGIYRRLPEAPAVVRVHLGQSWVDILFGKASDPLAGIAADLLRGDFGAQRTAALVGQLNKAETSRAAELRRRVRRGEGTAVRAELDQVLGSPSVSALAPEVRADFLRLSAALHLGEDEAVLAKLQLDEADALDGVRSQRLRAILCSQSLGPERALEGGYDASDPEVAEVLAIASLRIGDGAAALELLAAGLSLPTPSAETLRIAGLAHLAAGARDTAVDLARRALQRDGESRACAQLLAIALFARAVSPSFEMLPTDWPVPVDQALVLGTDGARADLVEADVLLTDLAADATLANHREMLAWSFAVRSCVPGGTSAAQEMLAKLVIEDRLTGPVVVWALSRGMALELSEARRAIRRERENDPDSQLLLLDVAISCALQDRPGARAILEQGRGTLAARGLAGYHRYWSAQLDMDDGRKPSQQALEEWPWLALRAAMGTRYKKRRLAEVARVAERTLADDGDPRILLAATQILFDAGRAGTASRFADALVDRVGTPEAITLAALSLHRAGMPERVLAALDRPAAFPGSILPPDLQRLRINSKAALGRLVEAARELSDLAAVTGAAPDIWTSIEWHLAVGAVTDARGLYVRHRERLASPNKGHLHLAHALIRTDPNLAVDITRLVAASAPDTMVAAAFELASRLRLDDEQVKLVRRIQTLGVENAAGVEMISDVSIVIERMERHRKHVDENYERYRNGHLAAQMLASFSPTAFAEQYLGNLIDPPMAPIGPPAAHARYGRRYDAGVWPERREDASLVVDLSALLTIHGLGLLPAAERAFRPLRIGPDVINAISHLRQKLTVVQPDRLDAARRLVEARDGGALPDPSELSPVDAFRVVWEVGDADAAGTINLSRLLVAMTAELGADRLASARSRLGELAKPDAAGPTPPRGATLILDCSIVLELQVAGALEAARSLFGIAVAAEEIEARRSEIHSADRQERLAGSLEVLADGISSGAKDGTYEFLPITPKPDGDAVPRQYFQCLHAMGSPGSILWIDDRFTTSIDQPAFPTVTSVEVLDALARYNRVEAAAIVAAKLRLRAAGWTFMTMRGGEIADLVRPAVKDGQLVEDERLRTMRRSAAWTALERRRLQWPSPEQAEQGARGEVPFLLDQGSAVGDALARMWSDASIGEDDAVTASTWILRHLDMNQFAPTPIAAGDARAELMVGLHLGHLLLISLQITPAFGNSGRRARYVDWVWKAAIGFRQRMYPELLPHVVDTLERNLVDDLLEDPGQDRIWKAICGDMINALPLELRMPLFARPDIRTTFGISDRGLMSVGDAEFDAVEYLTAIVEIEEGEPAAPLPVPHPEGPRRLPRQPHPQHRRRAGPLGVDSKTLVRMIGDEGVRHEWDADAITERHARDRQRARDARAAAKRGAGAT